MTMYITPDNKLHDDADGFALTLTSWPQDARLATQQEIDDINNPPKTFAEIVAEFESAIQAELDADAEAKGYDNILSACAYAGAPNPFQAEAELFISRRGNVWAYCYQELAKVQAGTRPMPTIEEIISELPPRVSA